MRHPSVFASIATALMLIAAPAVAQETDADSEKKALEDQKELIDAKAELLSAKLDYANVLFDQLPSYEGTIKTDDATGKFESTQLAADALGFVAERIASDLGAGKTLVLAGDEAFSFGMPFATNAEMRALHDALVLPAVCGKVCHFPEIAPVRDDGQKSFLAAEGFSVALSAINAVAGMLRSDVEYASLTNEAIDSRMLADAVAASLNAPASGDAHVLGGSPGAKVEPKELSSLNSADWSPATRIADKYAWLHAGRRVAQQELAKLKKTKASQAKNKDRIAALTTWTKDFDAFDARVAKPDDKGITPIGAAVRGEAIEDGLARVVRVDVEMAGGSRKTSKNIGTFFGGDPLRVTGGIIASYKSYDVARRSVPVAWGVWSCGSEQLHLSKVREARFKEGRTGAGSLCHKRSTGGR